MGKAKVKMKKPKSKIKKRVKYEDKFFPFDF